VWILRVLFVVQAVDVGLVIGIKKCLSIPNSALSATCLGLAITPTTACLDATPDFSGVGAESLAAAKVRRCVAVGVVCCCCC
jgi:hypothetical protein